MEKLPLTLSEYNRVHQTARGVLDGVPAPERSCIFFAVYGTYILKKHYKIPARPIAGGFALCVDDEPSVMCFGKVDGGRIVAASDGFHMWVQTPTHIIDFMAPIFREALGNSLPGVVVPRKMLQRPTGTEATTHNGMKATGDFITLPDPELTQALIRDFVAVQANKDLLLIAEEWFGSPRVKQQQTLAMVNDLGEVFPLSLPTTIATGIW